MTRPWCYFARHPAPSSGHLVCGCGRDWYRGRRSDSPCRQTVIVAVFMSPGGAGSSVQTGTLPPHVILVHLERKWRQHLWPGRGGDSPPWRGCPHAVPGYDIYDRSPIEQPLRLIAAGYPAGNWRATSQLTPNIVQTLAQHRANALSRRHMSGAMFSSPGNPLPGGQQPDGHPWGTDHSHTCPC